MDEGLLRYHHEAMATPWVLSVAGEEEETAAWAAREAFALIDRLEEDLSRFQRVSYVSQISRLQPGERLRVNSETFECLLLAKAVWKETQGAFDVTVNEPTGEMRWVSRMGCLELYEGHEVGVTRAGVAVDLGGIGKGFAIDEITQFFQDEAIENAFLDAGGSTLYGMGNAPGASAGWPAMLGEAHGVIALANQALSASGFEVKGRHVIDPRTGGPVETERQRAWVVAGSAALADALSTAALVMSEEEIAAFCETHRSVSIMLA
jgi:thiamine biosynthesis lipoprotein